MRFEEPDGKEKWAVLHAAKRADRLVSVLVAPGGEPRCGAGVAPAGATFAETCGECHQTSDLVVAEPADLPIPKGIAGPGMLADTIVHRWQDHLPLNRLTGLYKRDGLDLARSTICGWHEQLAGLARPGEGASP